MKQNLWISWTPGWNVNAALHEPGHLQTSCDAKETLKAVMDVNWRPPLIIRKHKLCKHEEETLSGKLNDSFCHENKVFHFVFHFDLNDDELAWWYGSSFLPLWKTKPTSVFSKCFFSLRTLFISQKVYHKLHSEWIYISRWGEVILTLP